jgi:phosphate transport system protein
MDGTQHNFQEQLESLSERLLRMGGIVEEAIGKSIRALVERDSDLASEVIAFDSEIDKLELEIDDLCMEVLARHQPMARDLRFITTAMKITPDLERIADHAVNISERVLELNEEPPLRKLVDMPLLANRAQEMVRGALDAFVRHDAQAARAVIKMDDEVDEHMDQVFRILLSHMMEDPKTVSRGLRLTFVAKYFERIADQATNICEMVVFMAEARVIKHATDEADWAR